MVVFNYSTRELTTKIVYYGPGLCGKTTNLQFIYDHMPQGVRGKMLSLATKSDRTLFFDFLPIDLGQIQGMKTKVQLYTVPGQVFYNETRRLVLKGADGVVFVADSQESMLEANFDSFRNLEENLAAHGLTLADLPHVLQFNKQDLPAAMPVEVLNEKLNRYNAPFYEAIATTGVGVQETLRHVTKLVLLRLNEKYAPQQRPPVLSPRPEAAPEAAHRPAPPPAPSPAPPPRPPFEIEAPTLVGSTADVFRAAAAPAHASGAAPPPHPAAVPEYGRAGVTDPDLLGVGAPRVEPLAPPFEDEDVLGIVPAPALAGGATIKIDRSALDLAPPPAARPAARPVAATATAVEVAPDDPLFREQGLEPTRLAPGQPQEILVPLEIETPSGPLCWRLTIRLEIAR
ncbi:MAG: hypothetical protein KBD01_10765 [Acidobacteria bacterium]|nr:hypothetical protein [Acidobacteriota bacterium]